MSEVPATKKCPFCSEEILADAIKCKHCGSDLRAAPPPVTVTTNKKPWIGGVGFGLLAVGAFACVATGASGGSPAFAVIATLAGAVVLGYALATGHIKLFG